MIEKTSTNCPTYPVNENINMSIVLGLDIGGANLKAATASGAAGQWPFALWQYPDQLGETLISFLEQFADTGFDAVAVTMTGELCDCYTSKREGVMRILDAVDLAVEGRPTGVWLTDGRLVSTSDARAVPMLAAASNWHALATFAGRYALTGPALLIDIGSTTTDIIPLMNGIPASQGLTDIDRLASQELVYTGIRRTPVCAILGSRVMAERFATAQDVYQRLGMLSDDANDTDTADNRPATAVWAHVRLARMLGGDGDLISLETTHALAMDAHQQQRAMIVAALHTIISRLSEPPHTVIFSGSGEFLARAASVDHLAQHPFPPTGPTAIISLSEHWSETLSVVAPAAALAILASEIWE